MAIREILTILAVTATTFAGFVNPRLGMYGYVWFSLFRPDTLSWSATKYPYGITMAIAILVGNVRNLHQIVPTVFLNAIPRIFFLLVLSFTLSTIQATEGAPAVSAYISFMKAAVMITMLPMLFNELDHVRRLFLVTAGSLGFIGMYFGVLGTLKGGIQIVSGLGGGLADNNMIALAMVIVLPFCWYGIFMTEVKQLRAVLAIMCFGCCATVVFTQSRGSFLGLALVLALLALQSKRKMLVLVMGGILMIPAAYLTWWRFSGRIATLADPTRESSANSRILSAQLALKVWRDHPLTGVGPGDECFYRVSGSYDARGIEGLAIHSTPFQVLAHLGVIGAVAWASYFGYALFYCFRSIARMKKRFPGWEIYPRAIATSLMGYLVSTLVYPRAWFEVGYMLPMFAACWRLVEKKLFEAAPIDTVAVPSLPPQPARPPARPARIPAARRPAWQRDFSFWSRPLRGSPDSPHPPRR